MIFTITPSVVHHKVAFRCCRHYLLVASQQHDFFPGVTVMFEQLKSVSEHIGIHGLLQLHEVFLFLKRERNKGNQPTLEQVAASLGCKRQALSKSIKEISRRLGLEGTLFESVKGRGTTPRHSDEEVFQKIVEVLAAYQRLMTHSAPSRMKITLGTTPILSIRRLPALIQEFYRNYPEGGIDVELVYDEPYRLMHRAGELDLVLTYCDGDAAIPDELKVGEPVRLHRCLHCPIAHPFNEIKTELERKTEFDFSLLSDQILVRPQDEGLLPGFKFNSIPVTTRQIYVRSMLELIAHCRSGGRNGPIGFGHVEFRSLGDEKYLTAIDMSNCKNIGTSQLCLLRPTESLRRDDQRHSDATRDLADIIKDDLGKTPRRYERARELTAKLSRLEYVYHTSLIEDQKRQFDRKWLRGKIKLEVTPSMFVRGVHTITPMVDHSSVTRIQVIGRLQVSSPSSSRYHIFYRATDQGTAQSEVGEFDIENSTRRSRSVRELAAMSVFCSNEELTHADGVVGVWVGATRWSRTRPMPAAGGLIVFHSRPNLTCDDLNGLIAKNRAADSENFSAAFLDLLGAATEFANIECADV